MCSVGGGSGGVVTVAHTGQTGGAVDGCTTVAGGAAVLQAEGLEAHLVVLCQDGPHLQAVVEGARHMEGHDTGGHGALGWEGREETELRADRIRVQKRKEEGGVGQTRDEKDVGRGVGRQRRNAAQELSWSDCYSL